MNFVLLIIRLYTILYIFLSLLRDVKFLGNIFLVSFLRQKQSNISVQFSHSVVSDSLWPHGLQNVRPPCPSPTPRVHPNPCPLSRWCRPTISSSVLPFSSCPQSFPAPASFPMSQVFTSGGQSIGGATCSRVLFFLDTLLSMSLDALWLMMPYTLAAKTDFLPIPAWVPRTVSCNPFGCFRLHPLVFSSLTCADLLKTCGSPCWCLRLSAALSPEGSSCPGLPEPWAPALHWVTLHLPSSCPACILDLLLGQQQEQSRAHSLCFALFRVYFLLCFVWCPESLELLFDIFCPVFLFLFSVWVFVVFLSTGRIVWFLSLYLGRKLC